MGKRPFDRIVAALDGAIAYVNGDTSRVIVHTPEEILARKKARHKQRAGLKIVSTKTDETSP